jgi:hypothetical protein
MNDNLFRVTERIGALVLEFYQIRLSSGKIQFHMADLNRFVLSHTGIAPDSAGRILRDMRKHGQLDYTLISRKESLYEFKRVQVLEGVQ